MKKLTFVYLLLLGIFFYSTMCTAQADKKIIRLGYGRVNFEEVVKDIENARVIYIGENHNDRSHHEMQLRIIKALHQKGYVFAIGLEMFTRENQDILDRWTSKKIDDMEFIKAFYDNWGIGWGYYKDIFLFAREKGVPLIGLNVPKEITKKVAENGFQSLTYEEMKKLPPGVSCELDSRYMQFLQEIFKAKSHDSRKFKNFCEAQVLWDQAMAYYLNQFMEKNKERKIVVLAGNIHSWKYGIPRQLKKLTNVSQKVIMQESSDELSKVSHEEADYLVFH